MLHQMPRSCMAHKWLKSPCQVLLLAKTWEPGPCLPLASGREAGVSSTGGLWYLIFFAVIWQQLAAETVRIGCSPLWGDS